MQQTGKNIYEAPEILGILAIDEECFIRTSNDVKDGDITWDEGGWLK